MGRQLEVVAMRVPPGPNEGYWGHNAGSPWILDCQGHAALAGYGSRHSLDYAKRCREKKRRCRRANPLHRQASGVARKSPPQGSRHAGADMVHR